MERLIFDTHCHYDDSAFDSDRDDLLSRVLPENRVLGLISMGTNIANCLSTVELTKSYGYVYGGVGIHPEDAAELPENWLETIKELALSNEKIVCIGEIGLDYHWPDACPKDRQKEVFISQLKLANELRLPVSIHDREAHGDILELLKAYRPKGAVHCFSGSVEMSRELTALGMYLGFGGPVTFKNARHAPEVVKAMPMERLLLETDAPYMSPEPFRGKRNDSSRIIFTARKIAEIRGMSTEAVLKLAKENGERLFGVRLGV